MAAAQAFVGSALKGKVVLVTGASSGLGRHMSKLFAQYGAKVAVAARRKSRLDDLVSEIKRDNSVGDSHVFAVGMDVTDLESVKTAVAQASSTLGPISVLVNNAGIAIDKPALRQTAEDWNKVMNTNLTGAWYVAQTVGRDMVKNKTEGCIINIASVAGMLVMSNLPAYCASKAGLVHLTKQLALEWSRYKIRVNAINPGYIITDLNRDFLMSPPGEKILRLIPQRRFGVPSDLDGLVLLMADEKASAYMTGSVVNIDGGAMVSSL